MYRIVIDVDVIAVPQRIVNRFVGVELLTMLRKISNMGIFPNNHRAAVGFDAFGQHVEQRCFAASIGADDGTAVVLSQGEVKRLENGMVVTLGNFFGIDNDIATYSSYHDSNCATETRHLGIAAAHKYELLMTEISISLIYLPFSIGITYICIILDNICIM